MSDTPVTWQHTTVLLHEAVQGLWDAEAGPRPEGQGGQGNGGQRRDQNANRDRRPRDGDELPRHIDPLKTTQFAKLDLPRRKPVKTGGQPDPTRTSIDSLAAGGKRHGGGGFGGGGNRGGGGGRFR